MNTTLSLPQQTSKASNRFILPAKSIWLIGAFFVGGLLAYYLPISLIIAPILMISILLSAIIKYWSYTKTLDLSSRKLAITLSDIYVDADE